MLLDLILFIVFLVVGVRVALSVRRESAIFNELKGPKSLVWLVLLVPLSPIVLMIVPIQIGWLPASLLALPGTLGATETLPKCMRTTVADHA